jgi:Cd2+/Zn2+-exporting ATPase
MKIKMNRFYLNVGLVAVLILGLILNQRWILAILGIIATIPVVISALKSIKNKSISIDLLAGLALTVSIINQEWSSVAFINLMITSARIFGIYIEARAKRALEGLMKLRPEKAKVKIKNKIIEIPIEKVKVGDILLIETGDRVAVDGIVISGFASINQSSLTGESLPILKKEKDKVFCSTLNVSGSLLIKAEKVGKDTSFQKIIDLVESAQERKIGVRSMIEKFTTIYISVTVIISITVYLITKDTTLVLALLLVTCADDIAVAVPLAYWGAIANAAKKGVIVKEGLSLEILKKVKVLIMDKTGTLTKGQIKVQHFLVFGNMPQGIVMKIAAGVGCVSSHPVSKAIVNFAQENKIDYNPMKVFEEIPGKGIKATNGDHKYFLGNIEFLESQKVVLNKQEMEKYQKIKSEGHNLVLLAKDKELIGLFGLGDQLRNGAKNAILELKKNGFKKIIMLTGDNSVVAKDIANEIGIDEYRAGLSPQEKLKFIEDEEKNGLKIAYVGDGVNDAASLIRADVGIAMGAIGTDAAIEAADITLMNDNLNKINGMVVLSKRLGKIVFENFCIWGTVNTIGLILVFAFKISPKTAAGYNFVTDFIPLINSLRIFKK